MGYEILIISRSLLNAFILFCNEIYVMPEVVWLEFAFISLSSGQALSMCETFVIIATNKGK